MNLQSRLGAEQFAREEAEAVAFEGDGSLSRHAEEGGMAGLAGLRIPQASGIAFADDSDLALS